MVQDKAVHARKLPFCRRDAGWALSFFIALHFADCPVIYRKLLAGVGMKRRITQTAIGGLVRRRAVIAALFFAAGDPTIFVGLPAPAATTLHGKPNKLSRRA